MDNDKILMGGSIAPLETDDEDTDSYQEDSSLEYDVLEMIDSIGTNRFKEMYFSIKSTLKNLDISTQREFCIKILIRIRDLYDFEFLPYPELGNQLDMNNIYDLIKFLSYDYIDFFSDVWRYIDVDLKTLIIQEYCELNSDKIIKEIEDQIESRDLSELITRFLRTYNKDGIVKWFIENTEKRRMMIVLQIMEGEQGE